MTERRNFLRNAALVAAGTMVATVSNACAMGRQYPDGIVYTKKNPGRWAKKVKSHAPKISITGKKVTIRTAHPMTGKHYIVRHTLVSGDGKVLGEKTFDPSDKEAVSTIELPPAHTSSLYATSFCNLHDFWVTEFTV